MGGGKRGTGEMNGDRRTLDLGWCTHSTVFRGVLQNSAPGTFVCAYKERTAVGTGRRSTSGLWRRQKSRSTGTGAWLPPSPTWRIGCTWNPGGGAMGSLAATGETPPPPKDFGPRCGKRLKKRYGLVNSSAPPTTPCRQQPLPGSFAVTVRTT